MLQLGQLQEVALERLGVLIDLAQFVLQLLEGRLQVDHLPRLGSFGTLARVQHRDAVLLDFLLEVAQLALHLVTSAHLVDELALERVHVRVELEEGNFQLALPNYQASLPYSHPGTERGRVLPARTRTHTRLHSAGRADTGSSLRCGTANPWLEGWALLPRAAQITKMYSRSGR